MKVEDFKSISIQGEGEYRLVREQDLRRLLNAAREEDPPPIPTTVGELVKLHRKIANLSLRRLGSEISIDHSHIHKIENGKVKRPRDNILDAMAQFFGQDFRAELENMRTSSATDEHI